MSCATVTGAAAGNGLAISTAFRACGHVVVGVDLLPIPDGACDFYLYGDVLDPAVVDRACSGHRDRPLSFLNNAGITIPGFSRNRTQSGSNNRRQSNCTLPLVTLIW